MRKILHSHASALALGARSLFLSLSDYLSHSVDCQLAFVSLAQHLCRTVIGRPILLSPKAACERVDFHLGENCVTTQRKSSKSVQFRRVIHSVRFVCPFLRVSRFKGFHLEEIKTKRNFSALYRRSGARTKNPNALCELFMCEVIGLLQLKCLCPKIGCRTQTLQFSATFSVFGRSTHNSRFLLFCSSNSGEVKKKIRISLRCDCRD